MAFETSRRSHKTNGSEKTLRKFVSMHREKRKPEATRYKEDCLFLYSKINVAALIIRRFTRVSDIANGIDVGIDIKRRYEISVMRGFRDGKSSLDIFLRSIALIMTKK